MPPRLPRDTADSADQQAYLDAISDARASVAQTPISRTVDGQSVVWAPQEGSQEAFLSCPMFEVLGHGTRGSGKSDALLMAYALHVGRGHGDAWRGVIFRRTYPELAEIVAKSERWFYRIFPGARFIRGHMRWEFPDGEVLMFRHMARPSDCTLYQGHELPFIGWEELTNWPDDRCYTEMFACVRTSRPGVPRMVRSTTNPYGPGTNWIRERFRLHGRWKGTFIVDDDRDERGELLPARVAIHSHFNENKLLLEADPNYDTKIAAAAHNEAMAAAWLEGSWDIVAGGMFTDVWKQEYNVVPNFDVPSSWRIDRAFDWGSSRPFSVGWYAQSDGSDLVMRDGSVRTTVRGDLFRIREWYGWSGKANEGTRTLAVDVAAGIVERELSWRLRDASGTRVRSGPADSAIFASENGMCVAVDMEKPVRIHGQVYRGISWTRADKRPGSRVAGWEIMRRMMRAARPEEGGLPREDPGLFVVGEYCPQFLRTVLSAPRDERRIDDVDTDAEDHVCDEVRYRCTASGSVARTGTTIGMF